MAHQTIQVTEIATIPGTNKIARVKSLNGHVYTVEEIREFIDEGVPITCTDKNGNVTTIGKKDESSIWALPDDSLFNNLSHLPRFDL